MKERLKRLRKGKNLKAIADLICFIFLLILFFCIVARAPIDNIDDLDSD